MLWASKRRLLSFSCFSMKASYSRLNWRIISGIGTSLPTCHCAPLFRDKSLSACAELPERTHAKPLYPLFLNFVRMVLPYSSHTAPDHPRRYSDPEL